MYKENKVVEFRKYIEKDFQINNITDLVRLKKIMANFQDPDDLTCEEMINWANENSLVCKDDKLKEFISKNYYLKI